MKLEDLSLKQKVGQMLMFSFHGTEYNEQLDFLLNDLSIGGVILFKRNITSLKQVSKLNSKISKDKKVQPFIALDQEGGPVQRIEAGITPLLAAMGFAACGKDPYELYKQAGRDLKHLGFSINFAPVADVNNNPYNPVINSRSYSDNPKEVAKFVLRASQGFMDAKLIATVKHFPGHGDTSVDSHLGLPIVSKSLEEIEKIELYPFKKAIENKANGIMMSHIVYKCLDEKNPASLSYNIITKLLKEKLGFKGLVVTDSLTMKAIWDNYSIKEIVKKGVLAGNDILCFCGKADLEEQQEIYHTFVSLVEEGEIPIARVDEAVEKILKYKEFYLEEAIDFENNLSIIAKEEKSKLAEKFALEAITLVKDQKLIPLKRKEKILSIFPEIKLFSLVDNKENDYFTLQNFLSCKEIVINDKFIPNELLEKEVRLADKIIFCTYNITKDDYQTKVWEKLNPAKTIVVSMRSPYDILHLRNVKNYICLYEATLLSLKSLVELLYSGKFKGCLPIKLEGGNMKIIRVKDYDEMSKKAAEIIADVVKKNPKANLGLATGSSPLGTYKNLIKMYKAGEISFKDVKSFNLDEYCQLDKNHEQSYYSYMNTNFFKDIDIKKANTHLPSSEGDDLEANCKKYNELLKKNPVDLQLLGIGGNGHIGFNEPGTSFSQETFVVKLAEKTREDNKRFFASIDEVPKYAITMGIKNIMDAKAILMVISGKGKQDAVNKLLSKKVSEDFPASILHKHPNVTVIIDDAAYGDNK
ncbi:MAG TPA: glucosamine-6-phosphate deaminase [Acholeplasma sp.]|nr:glucosamine-6-phosphate deaminase [Acholeplasma sp.]